MMYKWKCISRSVWVECECSVDVWRCIVLIYVDIVGVDIFEV